MESTIEAILKDMLTAIGFSDVQIERTEVAGQTVFSIEAGNNAHVLLGGRGDVIQALDHLVKKVAEKRLSKDSGEHVLFLIDVNGHRTKQIKDLQTKALMMAERARSFQYDVELSPMSSYERLIIHTTLQDAPHVKTESQGEGRSRRVVIKYSAE